MAFWISTLIQRSPSRPARFLRRRFFQLPITVAQPALELELQIPGPFSDTSPFLGDIGIGFLGVAAWAIPTGAAAQLFSPTCRQINVSSNDSPPTEANSLVRFNVRLFPFAAALGLTTSESKRAPGGFGVGYAVRRKRTIGFIEDLLGEAPCLARADGQGNRLPLLGLLLPALGAGRVRGLLEV